MRTHAGAQSWALSQGTGFVCTHTGISKLWGERKHLKGAFVFIGVIRKDVGFKLILLNLWLHMAVFTWLLTVIYVADIHRIS